MSEHNPYEYFPDDLRNADVSNEAKELLDWAATEIERLRSENEHLTSRNEQYEADHYNDQIGGYDGGY